MGNIFFWMIYYIKCFFNIIISYLPIYSLDKKNIELTNLTSLKKINSHLYLVKLSGDYLDMGKSYGRLMKNILKKDCNIFLNTLKKNNVKFNNRISKKYRKKNLFLSIKNLYQINKKNYNLNIINFIKGVSLTSNISFSKLLIINLFTDMMDNHCIILSKKINNKILNIRTLDYGAPEFSQTLIVFHPKDMIPYCSLNLSCIFGVVSGVSKNNIFFGETYHDNVIGEISYIGMPFHQVAHNILAKCSDIESSEKMLKSMSKTSNLELLISDKESSKIFLSNKDKFILKHDFYNTTKSKQLIIKNSEYLDTIENVLGKFIPKSKSGELHCFITYDNNLYVSVTTKYLQSYNNTFYKFNLLDLFKNS